MLKTRVFTALVLLSVFGFALFGLSASGWACFATAIAALAAWEWGGLIAMNVWQRVGLGSFMALVCGAFLLAFPSSMGLGADFSGSAWRIGRFLYIPACVFWLFCAPFWMKKRWPLKRKLPGGMVGILLILPTWLSLIQLKYLGTGFLLAVMAIVWLADMGGYFFGRLWGRHKLAPAISPGKTWEGVGGGVVSVAAYGFFLGGMFPGFMPLPALLGVMVFLALFSVLGDLFESLLKRLAGVKDSSSLLPGHGGILDRIDSLMSVLPLVALLRLSPCASWLLS